MAKIADKLLHEGREKYLLLAMDMAKVGGPDRLRSFPHEFEHPNVHSPLSFSQFQSSAKLVDDSCVVPVSYPQL